ncbi:MAG TPA: 50S ribosomal protein L15 [Alphaproteobacteria bacterium]|nr:50S ribosomal protein L15 [Alphaproteobacteria bacterium]
MKLNTLQPKEGSTKKHMRVGRGIGSGKGKTSGVGQKGQKSRKGVAIKGFEGGQMPLERRLPKFGFNNTKFAVKLVEVSLAKLQTAIDAGKLDAKKEIDEKALVAAGVIRRVQDGVKLLGTGTLKAKVDLKITKATASAQAAVEKAGGKIAFIVREVKPVVRKDGKVFEKKAK